MSRVGQRITVRVVAPDTLGYNLSSKPKGAEAYSTDLLAADICGLIHERGAETALLAGHDWGGSIAWTIAAQRLTLGASRRA
jgi:epoxide hydrolase 4